VSAVALPSDSPLLEAGKAERSPGGAGRGGRGGGARDGRGGGGQGGGGRGRADGRARVPRLLVGVALLTALPFVVPFAYLIRGVGGPAGLWRQLADDAARGALARTATLTLLTSLSAAVLGTALAWLTTRSDLPGRRIWRVVLTLPLAMPSFVGALALQAALGRGGLTDDAIGVHADRWLHGLTGSWVALTLFTYPYVMLPVAARLVALPPSLEESARLLGRRPAATFTDVVLPQIRPAIGAGSLLVCLYTIAEFGVVSVMRFDTLARVIYANRLLGPERSRALALALALAAAAVVVAERRVARRDQRRGASVSVRRRGLQVPLGRARPAALAGVAGVTLLGVVAPLAGLGYWVTVASSSGGGTSLLDRVAELGPPARTTAVVSLIAAVVATLLTLPLAYLTSRWRSPLGEAAGTVVVGAFALPGIVVALSVIALTLDTPGLGSFHRTLAALVLAYVAHFGAEAARSGQVALAAVPARYDDAARLLGAGWLRRVVAVDLPLILPGLAVGGGLVMLSVAKELPITLLAAPLRSGLADGRFETLATRVWSKSEGLFLADTGVAALALVAISGLLTWLLVIRPSHRQLDRS
jgi:iron(III) transport system permease protein